MTELVTGIDLVNWQLHVAAGQHLPLGQQEMSRRGHAIECRVYAEDPANGFLPSTGMVRTFRPPSAPGVRVDSGIQTGSEVTPHYDPMLAKIIVWGQQRELAISRMVDALQETILLGVTTNIPYLLDILQTDAFRKGTTGTSFLDDQMSAWTPDDTLNEEAWLAAGVLEQIMGGGSAGEDPADRTTKQDRQSDPWNAASRWRNVG